jgi:hypothetical protein
MFEDLHDMRDDELVTMIDETKRQLEGAET